MFNKPKAVEAFSSDGQFFLGRKRVAISTCRDGVLYMKVVNEYKQFLSDPGMVLPIGSKVPKARGWRLVAAESKRESDREFPKGAISWARFERRGA